MSNNSKKQFLETSRIGNIICPACGNPMSMREFASYQLVFTSKARQTLNTMVEHYVNFLTFFNDALLFHDQYGLDNIPLDVIPYQVSENMNELGFYKGTFADSVKVLCHSQESLAVLNKIRQLPKTQHIPEGEDHETLLKNCYSLLYGQIAPYDYVASLFEIVDQQYPIQHAIRGRGEIVEEDYQILESLLDLQKGKNLNEFFNATFIKSNLGNWAQLIKNLVIIAPGYARYLGFLIKLAKTVNKSVDPKQSQIDKTQASPIFFETVPKPLGKVEANKTQVITIKQVANCIMKFAHVLNIFLCGGYIEHDETQEKDKKVNSVQTQLDVSTNSTLKDRIIRPYRFGLNSIVQDWETLGKFITSYPALKIFAPYWPTDFVNRIRNDSTTKDETFTNIVKTLIKEKEPGSPKNIESTKQVLETIGEDYFLGVISSVVDFACRGKAMTLPNYNVRTKVFGGISKELREMARNWIVNSICGWCPSDRNAHSLVLMGGTGSGKSSIAQSGLVALSDSLSQFGYSLSYPGPVDEVVFDFFHTNHYKGHMPSATEEGARYTLTLSLQPIKNPKLRVDLVFTDISGEKIEAALLGGAEDPVVLGALRSAKTFVYLFDFIAWKTFASTLSSPNLEAKWEDFVKQNKRLNDKSRAVRDSFEMLKAVVDKIYEIRKQEGNKEEDPYKLARDSNFILVFPKADLYWESQRFLSKFFNSLKELKIVHQSLSAVSGKYVSRGISIETLKPLYEQMRRLKQSEVQEESDLLNLDDISLDGTPQLESDDVLRIAKMISDRAKEALTKDFKEAFKAENGEFVEEHSLPTVLKSGIIEFLEARFNNVYFFPVSAQGVEQSIKQASNGIKGGTPQPIQAVELNKDGDKGVILEAPAAQALCEFIFLVAAASAMKSVS